MRHLAAHSPPVDWSPRQWIRFADEVWATLSPALRWGLLRAFPQSESVVAALEQGDGPRPTLGLCIAAAQPIYRLDLLDQLFDFSWWRRHRLLANREQLLHLTRDRDHWGIRWLPVTVSPSLLDRLAVPPSERLRLIETLAHSLSLTVTQKRTLLGLLPRASAAQLRPLTYQLQQEQLLFALQPPWSQERLGFRVLQARESWVHLMAALG